jgi:hypothetical protein
MRGRLHAGLRRREFLAGSVAVGSSVVVGAAAAVANRSEETFAGTISAIAPPGRARVELVTGESAVVVLAPDAVVVREQAVGLDAFVPGERVAFAGQRTGDKIEATSFELMYELVELTVDQRSGPILTDGSTRIRVADGAKPVGGEGVLGRRQLDAKSLHRLGHGDTIVAEGRHDPRTGDVVVFRVGVLPTEP